LGPDVLVNSLRLDPSRPLPASQGGSDDGVTPAEQTDKVTSVLQPFIDGLAEQSAFGNTVRIELVDLTVTDTRTYNQVIGTGFTDSSGRFVHIDPITGALVPGIQVNAGVFLASDPPGPRTIGARAINDSGVVGSLTQFTFVLNTAPVVTAASLALDPLM